MSAQTTLDDDAPVIYDATCSYSKVWPRWATIRGDNRFRVYPDIVADAQFLPFRSGVFDEVYCDPPHMMRTGNSEPPRYWKRNEGKPIKKGSAKEMSMFEKYGFWKTRDDWLHFINLSGTEFRRILKESGRLHYKITEIEDGRMGPKDMALLTSFVIEKQRTKKSASNHSESLVHWFTMKPKLTTTKEAATP